MKRFDCSLSSGFDFSLDMCAHLPVSRSVGQPLADDASHDPIGALFVINAKGDTVTIAEIELREIANTSTVEFRTPRSMPLM